LECSGQGSGVHESAAVKATIKDAKSKTGTKKPPSVGLLDGGSVFSPQGPSMTGAPATPRPSTTPVLR
jgi:hypothetical protein